METGSSVIPGGVPFGSDAGWMPREVPTIVLGPGDIAQAHAVDEFVDLREVAQAVAVYYKLVADDWGE